MAAGLDPVRSERGGSGSWLSPCPIRKGEVEAGLATVRSERGGCES